jgi:hypothetical protein
MIEAHKRQLPPYCYEKVEEWRGSENKRGKQQKFLSANDI